MVGDHSPELEERLLLRCSSHFLEVIIINFLVPLVLVSHRVSLVLLEFSKMFSSD
jgi:hypothetical protein